MQDKVFSTYNQYDPVLGSVLEKVKVPVISGAQEINAFKQSASSASASSITWNYLPIGGTMVSPLIYWQQTMTVEVTADASLPATRNVLEVGSNHCFSRYPLLSMINNSIVTIDTANISEEYGEVWDATNQLIDSKSERKWSSLQPTGTDVFYHNYDLDTSATAPAGSKKLNSIYDPFKGYGQALPEYSRGGFISDLNITANPLGDGANAKVGTFTCTMTTPLLVKPFALRSDAVGGGFDIRNKLTVNLILKQLSAMNFIRNKSVVPITITNLTFTPQTSNLLMFVYMPHPTKPLPVRSSHVYHHITRTQINFTPSVVGSNTKGISNSVTSPSINLGVMPEKIVCFARKIKSAATCQDSDAFLYIKNLKINLDGKSNLLANASEEQLFDFSLEAGLQRKDWNVYHGSVTVGMPTAADGAVQVTASTVSSPIYLDVGKHIQTNSLAVPNEMGNFNCYITAEIVPQTNVKLNAGAPADQYEFVVLFLHRAILTLQNGVGVVLGSGLLDRSEVLSVMNEPSEVWKNYAMYGGANWYDRELYKNKSKKANVGHLESKISDLEEKLRKLEAKEGEGRASGRASGNFDPSQALIAKIKAANK